MVAQLVIQGLRTAALVSQGFASALTEPSWAPTVDDFKDYFDRDFVYGTGFTTVRDKDIAKALQMVFPVFNQSLWNTDEIDPPFLFAAAHFLVVNLQAGGGLLSPFMGAGSRGSGTTQSKSVGQVSVNYALDQKLSNDPLLSQFLKTNYGQTFLQLLTPRLVAPGFVVSGRAPTPFQNPNGPFVQ